MQVRNSARIISLSGGRPVGFATGGLSMEEDDHDESHYGSRKSYATSPTSTDWQSPFSIPDPLTYDTTRACTMLTDHHVRPKTTIPRIFINGCDLSNKDASFLTDVVHQRSSLEFHSPTLKDRSTHAPKRRYSENSTNTRHESEARADAACTMYVPYRPWYEPIKKMDSRLDMHSVQEPIDTTYEAYPTSVQNATTSSVVTTEQKLEQASPPMPIRSPPPAPLSTILRNKRKPPAPPRRRAYSVASSTHPGKQIDTTKEPSCTPVLLIAHTGAHAAEGSTSGPVKLPYLTELKRFLDGKPMSQGGTSIEKLCSGATEDDSSASIKGNRISRSKSMETFAGPQIHRGEMKRTRSASAPELTTPRPRLPVVSRLFELPGESTVAPGEPRHNVREEVKRINQAEQGFESLDPSLMLARMDHICSSWNSRQWYMTESYLIRHLSMVQYDHEIARKVRHLLGVCASYRGQWQRALEYFISVVNKPVQELHQLDCGDKAAFYWLGDTYSLLQRNEEALLAYCLAGSCDDLPLGSFTPRSSRCLLVNQERLRQTVSKSSFKDIWADASFYNGYAPRGVILHCAVVNQSVAQLCLQSSDLTPDKCSIHGANRSAPAQSESHMPISDMLLIAPSHLESASCWPMPHDPTFNLQAVVQGSLIAKHTDILEVLQQTPEALHFSKSFLPNLSDSHCVDLRRLITAVRESLQTLAMRWHEVVSLNGVFFLARHDSIDGHIATLDYFRIEVTSFALRNGFGLNSCSQITGRARKTNTYYHNNGSLDGATKRELKCCLRAAIESACARHATAGSSTTAGASRLLLRLSRGASASASAPASVPTQARQSTESSVSPAELETPVSSSTTPQSSVDLSTLVPPIGTAMPSRARDRISVRSSYNERHLLGPLVR